MNRLKIILAIVLLVLGYYTAYNHGKLSAQKACADNLLLVQKSLDNSISSLESSLSKLVESGEVRDQNLSDDISQILNNTKKKPIIVTKNGECTPALTFVDSINQAVDRANKK